MASKTWGMALNAPSNYKLLLDIQYEILNDHNGLQKYLLAQT